MSNAITLNDEVHQELSLIESLIESLENPVPNCSSKVNATWDIEQTRNKIKNLRAKVDNIVAKAKKGSSTLFVKIKKLGNLNVRSLKQTICKLSSYQPAAIVRHVQPRTTSSSKSNADPDSDSDSDSEPSHAIKSSYQSLVNLSAQFCHIQSLSSLLSVAIEQLHKLSIVCNLASHSVDTSKDHSFHSSHQDRILRLSEVVQLTGLSRSTIYNKIDKKSKYYDPSFPEKFNIGLRSIGFLESELNVWIQSKSTLSQGE